MQVESANQGFRGSQDTYNVFCFVNHNYLYANYMHMQYMNVRKQRNYITAQANIRYLYDGENMHYCSDLRSDTIHIQNYGLRQSEA